MNSSLLQCPIFSYSFCRVRCQDCCEFSHPQDMTYTLTVHLNIRGGEKGGAGGRGEGGKGGEQDTLVKSGSRWRGGTAGLISKWKATKKLAGDSSVMMMSRWKSCKRHTAALIQNKPKNLAEVKLPKLCSHEVWRRQDPRWMQGVLDMFCFVRIC